MLGSGNAQTEKTKQKETERRKAEKAEKPESLSNRTANSVAGLAPKAL